MTDSSTQSPPAARIPTSGELKVFAQQTAALLSECIEQFTEVNQLNIKIKLGLLVKLLKVYRNMFVIAETGDSDTPPILARIIYELALSFVFLIINEDEHPEYFEMFKQTALQRQYDLMKNEEKIPENDRESNKDMIEGIKQMLRY